MRRALCATVAALALSAPAHATQVPAPPGTFEPFHEGGASAAELLAGDAWLDVERVLEAHHELHLAGGRVLTPRQAAQLGRGPDGGRGVAHRAGARPVADPPYPVPSGVHVSTGRNAVEPSLGVASDGTLFYVGVSTADGQHSVVQRSRDEGKTWEVLDLLAKGVPNDTVTADPLIYLDPGTDRLFNFDYTPPCSAISFSDDGGDTFGVGVACNHFDHQTLFAGPAPDGGAKPTGYANVVYYCAIEAGVSAVGPVTGCSKSLDGGVTYNRTGSAPFISDFSRTEGGTAGIPGACLGTTGHGRVGPDGTVYVPRGFCDQPFLAISRDEGDTWERVQVADIGMAVGVSADLGFEDHEARVAIDPSGTVYYTWIARDHLPYLAISRDGGKTFGKPLMVAPPGVQESFGPSIAAGADGRIALAYVGTTNSPGGPFCVKTTLNSCTTADGSPGKPPSAYEKTTWNAYVTMSVDATAADPIFYSASGNAPADPIHRGYCGGIQCGVTHEFHDVVIGPDGTPWGSFGDGCIGDPAAPCEGSGAGVGIAARLVGGPPLVGTLPELKPSVLAPADTRACTSRLRFPVRVRQPRRGRIASVRMRLNGRALKVRRSRGRYSAVVDLRRLRGRTVVLRITTRTTAGRTYRETRRYRAC